MQWPVLEKFNVWHPKPCLPILAETLLPTALFNKPW